MAAAEGGAVLVHAALHRVRAAADGGDRCRPVAPRRRGKPARQAQRGIAEIVRERPANPWLLQAQRPLLEPQWCSSGVGACHLRCCRQPEHGLPQRTCLGRPDDGVQRAPRALVRQPGGCERLEMAEPADRHSVPVLRAARTHQQPHAVRLPERRRPLRKPRHLRAGAPALPLHPVLRCRPGRQSSLRRPRQCHPQVPG